MSPLLLYVWIDVHLRIRTLQYQLVCPRERARIWLEFCDSEFIIMTAPRFHLYSFVYQLLLCAKWQHLFRPKGSQGWGSFCFGNTDGTPAIWVDFVLCSRKLAFLSTGYFCYISVKLRSHKLVLSSKSVHWGLGSKARLIVFHGGQVFCVSNFPVVCLCPADRGVVKVIRLYRLRFLL